MSGRRKETKIRPIIKESTITRVGSNAAMNRSIWRFAFSSYSRDSFFMTSSSVPVRKPIVISEWLDLPKTREVRTASANSFPEAERSRHRLILAAIRGLSTIFSARRSPWSVSRPLPSDMAIQFARRLAARSDANSFFCRMCRSSPNRTKRTTAVKSRASTAAKTGRCEVSRDEIFKNTAAKPVRSVPSPK